jgi:8-amino-3,8-dideoxy-alpha-D-manno-octulosonate transaminase
MSTTTLSASPATAPALRPRPLMGLGSALIGAEEEALVLDVLRRKAPFRYYGGIEGSPPMAATLEQEFREKMGSKFALAVSSGTAALEVALGALGIGPGDEVIVPAWSWVSCFTAIVRLGALPVLAEIDESFCLAPGAITHLATPRTKAVLVVHYQGISADMDAIMAEAKTHGIKVIEDCAESAGASYHGARVGTIGDIGTFSFQYQKVLTSGEGGMVITNDPLLYERAVRMHDLGNFRPYHRQLLEPQVPAFCGSQFRLSELPAAMALAQLRKIDGMKAHTRRLSARILKRIGALPGLELRHIPDPEGDLGFEIYLRLPSAEMVTQFRTKLDAMNVNCNRTTGTYCHFAHEYCAKAQAHTHSASPFKHFEAWPAPGYREQDFPRTNALTDKFIALPIGALYTDEDADYIGECVAYVYGELMA